MLHSYPPPEPLTGRATSDATYDLFNTLTLTLTLRNQPMANRSTSSSIQPVRAKNSVEYTKV